MIKLSAACTNTHPQFPFQVRLRLSTTCPRTHTKFPFQNAQTILHHLPQHRSSISLLIAIIPIDYRCLQSPPPAPTPILILDVSDSYSISSITTFSSAPMRIRIRLHREVISSSETGSACDAFEGDYSNTFLF